MSEKENAGKMEEVIYSQKDEPTSQFSIRQVIPITIKFNIFCLNFAHISCLTMSTKECLGFFYFS